MSLKLVLTLRLAITTSFRLIRSYFLYLVLRTLQDGTIPRRRLSQFE